MANNEISKAVLHETLTTEIGEKGSYAAASTHNDVREEVAEADRKRISEAFNLLAGWYTLFNYGAKAPVPRFEYVQDEDLQEKRAKRDVDAYSIGWRPNKDYFVREYGFQEDEFEVAEAPLANGGFEGFSHSGAPVNGLLGANNKPVNGSLSGHNDLLKEGFTPSNNYENCQCGCGEGKKKKSMFKKFLALFASKSEKANAKAAALMEEFADSQLEKGQKEIDKSIEAIAAALDKVNSYEEATDAIADAVSKYDALGFANCIDNVRYVAQVLGERNG
jgi:hypothetical protein